ncbi:MAG: hypothetical protein QOI24_3501 [Acidobacteriota bacterium]|nr:hypothetical protein [Acidobacteriota bacterium]
MKITIEGRETALREQLRNRLRERLDNTAKLRCTEHGGPVVAVSIHGRENGWYDTMWTTCCDDLERRASAILKKRF